MAGIYPRKVLYDDRIQMKKRVILNGVDSSLDYIEEYEVLLSCYKSNSTLLKLFLMLGSAQKESASFVKVRSTSYRPVSLLMICIKVFIMFLR